MNRKYLAFGAIALMFIFGILNGIFQDAAVRWLGPVSTAIVVLAWIGVGVFGKSEPQAPQVASTPADPTAR